MLLHEQEEKLSQSYLKEEWQRGYQSQPNEYDYWVDDIEGEIPLELEGTVFRNGPGLFEIGGTPIKHPFDGDGMISRITFKQGKVHFMNRFIRTQGYVEEQKAGKILYRGVFGTQKPGGWLGNIFDLKFKNIANTNIIFWGQKLLALWEAAQPHRLDPHSLETLGLDNLEGLLQPGRAFSAHPRFDPSSQYDGGKPCFINYSIQVGLSSKINLFEFDLEGQLLRQYSYTTPGFCFIHDFVITPHYCIFFQSYVTFNPLPQILGFKGAAECLKIHYEKPTRIILIPRTPPHKAVKVLEVPAGFVFHHVNGFEEGERIFIDSVCYQSIPQTNADLDYKEVDFKDLDPGQLWRFTLDLKKDTATRQMIEEHPCEFPVINPNQVGKPYRYLFIGAAHNATGNGPLQGLLKLDLHTHENQFYSFAPHGYVGEPLFIPKPNGNAEDEGWIIMMVYDGRRHLSDVVIFDGQNINSGPLAKVHLKHHIPYGLHGFWTTESFLDIPDMMM